MGQLTWGLMQQTTRALFTIFKLHPQTVPAEYCNHQAVFSSASISGLKNLEFLFAQGPVLREQLEGSIHFVTVILPPKAPLSDHFPVPRLCSCSRKTHWSEPLREMVRGDHFKAI